MREKDVNLPCRIFAILVMLFLLAPLVVIVIASFTPTALITFPPQGFSLKWYANIFGSSTHFMDGLVNSLKIGILATAADILLGVTAALSVCRYSFKGKDALLNYYTSPMYVPSVAFAFVLLQVYSQIGGVPGMLRIFIGHLIIILPYIVRNTVSVLHVFNWTLEDAATSMGATPIQVFFKITIPLARPGIMAGALLAFLYSFDEVALSSLLSTPRFITSWPPETQDILDYQWNEVAIPKWKELVRMAEDCGIRQIALENHGMQLVYNPETLFRLREAVGPMVGMNLDPSHLFWMGGDPIEAARVLGEQGALYHVHGKDSRPERRMAGPNGLLDTKPIDQFRTRSWNYVAVGCGHGAQWWKEFFSTVRMAGYDGDVSLEMEDLTMPMLEGHLTSLRVLKEALVL